MITQSPKPPDHTRGFFDPAKLRDWVLDNAKTSFQDKLNKIETDQHKLQVTHLEYGRKGVVPLKEQKQALMEKRDVVIPLHGTVNLIDKHTGKVVESKKTLLANIPYVTDRNTVILNGSEYIHNTQQRLKPGIFTRVKESGEMEAHINVLPGTGLSGKLIFDPQKTIFTYQLGTTQIKLYGLLKELGVPDSMMRSAWGEEVFRKNQAAFEGNELEKFYNKAFERK